MLILAKYIILTKNESSCCSSHMLKYDWEWKMFRTRRNAFGGHLRAPPVSVVQRKNACTMYETNTGSVPDANRLPILYPHYQHRTTDIKDEQIGLLFSRIPINKHFFCLMFRIRLILPSRTSPEENRHTSAHQAKVLVKANIETDSNVSRRRSSFDSFHRFHPESYNTVAV